VLGEVSVFKSGLPVIFVRVLAIFFFLFIFFKVITCCDIVAVIMGVLLVFVRVGGRRGSAPCRGRIELRSTLRDPLVHRFHARRIHGETL
jgi:hypothetical protein